jgi:isopenicillin N synthase-like dioxygenase
LAALTSGGQLAELPEQLSGASHWPAATRQPVDLIERAHAASRRFFDLNVETKLGYAPAPGGYLGYRGVGSESLAYSLDEETPADLKESFTIGRGDVGDDPYFTSAQGKMYFPPNCWPGEVPERGSWRERRARALGFAGGAIVRHTPRA